VCGVATPENEKYCSAVCEAKYTQEAEKYKRQQKMSYIFIGIMGVLVILMFALPYLIPGLFS
jgi:predicted nucleic acid-binding Zn ribbon protein